MFNETTAVINAKPTKCDFCPYPHLNEADVLICPSSFCELSPAEIKSIWEMMGDKPSCYTVTNTLT